MTFSEGLHTTWVASKETLHFYSNTLLEKKSFYLQNEHSNELSGSTEEVFSRSNDQASGYIIAESFASRQRK